MNDIPAFPGLIAKIVVILDKAMGAFATVEERPISEGCGITAYYVNMTGAGDTLANSLSQLIYGLVNYLGDYFAALTSVAT